MSNPTEEKQSHHQPPPPPPPPPPPSSPHDDKSSEKWGTQFMGQPSAPSAHPQNQQAAMWNASYSYPQQFHPYLIQSPIDKPSSNPMEFVIHAFNDWAKKTDTLATNVWNHLKTGPSVTDAAWGKLSLTAKAITEGGFESLYNHTFQTDPKEKLKKTFACYLSTTTGPVAGTLYLSNLNVAFGSDRPLRFTAPSGQQTWGYYKVLIPLAKISAVHPVCIKENPPEKYIQIVTVDGHDFWFMGFVSYDKAYQHLSASLAEFAASQRAAEPVG
eukprot:TRINITY_DN1876_c0_g3_i1.p1 TRINITY_DN1876_c0_g3~~TRINITY_DN1876_c0_g3_i1.p1  ORF type:complete len:311 (-),score=29.16 TRINITY_DN1876_c0_g3_i1:55-867(-)